MRNFLTFVVCCTMLLLLDMLDFFFPEKIQFWGQTNFVWQLIQRNDNEFP